MSKAKDSGPWDYESVKAAELERARRMTPAQRLRWLDEAFAELSGWVRVAHGSSGSADEAPSNVPRDAP